MLPWAVTIELEIRVLSIISMRAIPSSLSAGREKQRVVPSPKTPTRHDERSSKSTTAAASQNASSNVLCAPLESAGLKMCTSDCVTFIVLADLKYTIIF